MSVLILAPESDGHAQVVAEQLRARGHEHTILDLSRFPEAAGLQVKYACCREPVLVWESDGRRLDLAQVGAAWWRRPGHPEISAAIAHDRHRAFALNECLEALGGIWPALDAFWVNDPGRDQVAHRKVVQLRIAQQLGLTVPETLITNDPQEARVFLDRRGYRDVVFKPFSALEDQWRETRMVGEAELAVLDSVRHAPVIFQEYIDAVYDLRITIVGDRVFPAAIHSQQTAYPVDCRMDIGRAAIEAVAIPAEVEAQLLALMRRLGLVYGAIDMRRRRSDDRLVFLEINPAGQWLFVEQKTGQPIARTLADLLAEQDLSRGERAAAREPAATA